MVLVLAMVRGLARVRVAGRGTGYGVRGAGLTRGLDRVAGEGWDLVLDFGGGFWGLPGLPMLEGFPTLLWG